MAFMHIRHVGALVVVPALPMANRCRCTLVQDPLYFGLLDWTLAHFQEIWTASRPIMRNREISYRTLTDLTATGPVKPDMSCWRPLVPTGCCTSPRGAVVLWSSTPCTLAYLPELWPTLKKVCPLRILT
jgi:hypothetical protein